MPQTDCAVKQKYPDRPDGLVVSARPANIAWDKRRSNRPCDGKPRRVESLRAPSRGRLFASALPTVQTCANVTFLPGSSHDRSREPRWCCCDSPIVQVHPVVAPPVRRKMRRLPGKPVWLLSIGRISEFVRDRRQVRPCERQPAAHRPDRRRYAAAVECPSAETSRTTSWER